jgi:hypothetical protein
MSLRELKGKFLLISFVEGAVYIAPQGGVHRASGEVLRESKGVPDKEAHWGRSDVQSRPRDGQRAECAQASLWKPRAANTAPHLITRGLSLVD